MKSCPRRSPVSRFDSKTKVPPFAVTVGDDSLEDFIEHHPTDPELPTVFEKLDQIYQAERQASSQELSRWANDPVQPRRALAEWYLARAELRAGRREAAARAYAKLREDRTQLPALAAGLF